RNMPRTSLARRPSHRLETGKKLGVRRLSETRSPWPTPIQLAAAITAKSGVCAAFADRARSSSPGAICAASTARTGRSPGRAKAAKRATLRRAAAWLGRTEPDARGGVRIATILGDRLGQVEAGSGRRSG